MSIKQKIGQLINKIAPVSPETISIVRVEFRALRNRINYRIETLLRERPSRNFLSNDNNISLNIGCGPFGQDGWVNVDLTKLPNVSFTYDSRRHLPFKDQTVARVRVEHFFEHLDIKTFEVPFFSLKNVKG